MGVANCIEQYFEEKFNAVKGDLKTYTSRKKPPSERHLTLDSFGSSARKSSQ
jgi:hypothetical protein